LPSAFGGVCALRPDEKRRDPGHVVLSGKNCCVVTPDVIRRGRAGEPASAEAYRCCRIWRDLRMDASSTKRFVTYL